MYALNHDRRTDTRPLLLLVESDLTFRYHLLKTLRAGNFRIAIARTVSEALEMLDDLVFIGAHVDALLVGYRLKDGFSGPLVQALHRQFPSAPVAVLVDDNLAGRISVRSRGISIIPKQQPIRRLQPWLQALKAST